jgi:16S rRNA (cytosine1402-N4)-methyltransferase
VSLFLDAPAGAVVDATVGAGGHAHAVTQARLGRDRTAQLIGLDRDPVALELSERRLAPLRPDARIDLVRTRFDSLPEVLDELDVPRVAAVLLDLGISSMHIDQADRGFSYRNDGPLDMRMDPDLPVSANGIVNDWPAQDIARVLRTYAEERFADRIARALIAARPITSTAALADIVRDAIPAAARRTGGHPATRTFQAIRIAVNDELGALDAVLPTVIDRLLPGGVAVVLSYQSLEDRRVKRAFAEAATGCICPPQLAICACGRTPLVEHLIRRPERPSPEEIAANPRATSALLRAVRRLEGPSR